MKTNLESKVKITFVNRNEELNLVKKESFDTYLTIEMVKTLIESFINKEQTLKNILKDFKEENIIEIEMQNIFSSLYNCTTSDIIFEYSQYGEKVPKERFISMVNFIEDTDEKPIQWELQINCKDLSTNKKYRYSMK